MYRQTCQDCYRNRPCSEHRVNIYLKPREPEWMRRRREQGLPAKDLTGTLA